MSWMFFVILVAALLLGGAILVIIMSRGAGRTNLNVDKFRSAWLAIEQQVERDNTASYQLAILNADKLLDKALRERGFKGEAMGERMKSASKVWRNANPVWTAHKLRNQIAHETDVHLTLDKTRRALAAFKQGLKDLGAI